MKSIPGNFVFYNTGPGLFGQAGPVYNILSGICIFIRQIILTTVRLQYFSYRPVVRLGRSDSCKKWQPFKKSNPGNLKYS